MAAQYANRPVPPPINFADMAPPPTVVIDLPPPEDDVPSYLPPRVSSFKQPPPLSQSPPGSENVLNANPVTGADEDPTVRNVVIAQTAIRGWLARKDYKVLYEQNRWRLEVPKVVAPRLVSPAKNKVQRKSRPPSRGFRPEHVAQHNPDPEPSGTPDSYLEGHEAPQEEDKPRAPRKSYAPGMLGPGMGIGEFDPSLVRLKSNPRPVSMDLKIAAQSPPLKHPLLKPVPAHISTASGTPQTKSMPDMPGIPKLKPVPHSPLAADGLPPPPPPDSPPHHATLTVPEMAPKRSPAVPKKPGPKMVLPPEWEMHIDIQGRKYYYNTVDQETTWTPPQMVPEHVVVKKIKQPQQHHSQNNLFGNLEMLIPQHKFAPQVPRKPPPPPTTGTPPPPEHSPLPATPLTPDTPPLIFAPPLSLDSHPASSSSSSTTTTTTTSTHPPTQADQPPAHATLPAASGTSVQPSSSNNSVSSNPHHPPLERTSSEQHRDKRSALRKLLDAFLGRRPSKDDLVKRGVLPDEEPKKDAKEKKKLEKERKRKEKEEKKEEKKKAKK